VIDAPIIDKLIGKLLFDEDQKEDVEQLQWTALKGFVANEDDGI